jgi:penicillin amidase
MNFDQINQGKPSLFNRFAVSSRFMVFMLIPLITIVILGYVHLNKSVPIYNGELALVQLRDKVSVTFTDTGVPDVVASNDWDAYFSQGYLHASERMWQMELQRRLVSGRLSELMGQASVPSDIWMRTLGLRRNAAGSWDVLGNDTKTALQAYSAGVNAWITSTAVLPPEFMFFGINPEPWQPTDSLAWQKAFALSLGLNMHDEIARFMALKQLSVEKLKVFFPFDPDYQLDRMYRKSSMANIDVTEGQDYRFDDWLTLATTFEKQWSVGGKNVGSNAWVIGAQHTRSGAPILANDPHLSVQQPSLWYAMSLKGNKLAVTGMSLVGLPGIILGRNRDIAWGATSLMSDQQDLFILDIPLGKKNVYRGPEGDMPITSRIETIEIRSDFPEILNGKIEPLKVVIRDTKLGPIVTDAVNTNGVEMALRWSALDSDDRSLESYIALQTAKNWQQFRDALALHKSPGLHFVYADTKGNIASQVAAHLPIRGFGEGILPNLAVRKADYWRGYVDFESLPSQFNPTSGVIIAANNHLQSKPSVVISHEWATDARKNRIDQLLASQIAKGEKFTLKQSMAIQLDQLDFDAARLAPLLTDSALRPLLISDADPVGQVLASTAFELVAKWDGLYSTHSAAASIYHYWIEGIKRAIFNQFNGDILSRDAAKPLQASLLARVYEPQLIELITTIENNWCQAMDNALVGCQQALIDGFAYALNKLKEHTASEDVARWQWGELHKVEYKHQPFGHIKPFDSVFKTSYSVGGSVNSINAANAYEDQSGNLQQTFGTSFRYGFDLGIKQSGAFSLPTGQSGHFLSPFFNDMGKPFLQGDTFGFSRKINQLTNLSQTLSLLPLTPSSQESK